MQEGCRSHGEEMSCGKPEAGAGAVTGLFWRGAAAARRTLSAAALGLGGGFGWPGLLPLPVSKGGIHRPNTLGMPAFPPRVRPGHTTGFLGAEGGQEGSCTTMAA